MIIWTVTFFLIISAAAAWLFLKKDPQKYIHRTASPINLFFKFGTKWHYFFKIIVLALVVLAIYSFYKLILGASETFSLLAAAVSGIVLSMGKELLDYKIEADDVIASIIGILSGFILIIIIF